jgi:hypothetical protein
MFGFKKRKPRFTLMVTPAGTGYAQCLEWRWPCSSKRPTYKLLKQIAVEYKCNTAMVLRSLNDGRMFILGTKRYCTRLSWW